MHAQRNIFSGSVSLDRISAISALRLALVIVSMRYTYAAPCILAQVDPNAGSSLELCTHDVLVS